jgi:hypothetical protein
LQGKIELTLLLLEGAKNAKKKLIYYHLEKMIFLSERSLLRQVGSTWVYICREIMGRPCLDFGFHLKTKT